MELPLHPNYNAKVIENIWGTFMRICYVGYALGRTMHKPTGPPFLLNYTTNHILCYDVECEFAGPSYSTYQSPILWARLLCSCGWKQYVSRRDLFHRQSRFHVRSDNRGIVYTVLRIILTHKPIFTMGHSVYGYVDNVLLCNPDYYFYIF